MNLATRKNWLVWMRLNIYILYQVSGLFGFSAQLDIFRRSGA